MSSVDRSFSAAMQSHLGFSLYLILTTFSGAYASEESKIVNGKPGRNVTLECVVPTQDPIEVLKWIRPDLKAEGFVLFYRDKVIKPTYQHPSYVSRVELRDPEMKHGDVSLILMNSNVNDSGRYEGHVSLSGVGRRRRAQSELRCVISLSIRDSGDAHENTLNRLMGENLIVYSVVAVFSLIFLAGTSYAVIRRCRHQQRLENCQVLEMDDQLFQRVEIENSL